MNIDQLSVFILAGGFGTRLKSVVSDVPKPMAPINNKPFLAYQIEFIREYFPMNKIYLLTYYLSEIIEDYFKEDNSILILKEYKPLGTGGSVKNAIKELSFSSNESILVLNGDTYIKPDLKSMIETTKSKISILGSFQKKCDRYGTLNVEHDKIVDFNEKKLGMKNSFINAGCYYFKDLTFFDNTKEEEFAIEEKFKDYLLNNSIDIFKYDDIFIDIGIPEDYSQMIEYVKEIENDS